MATPHERPLEEDPGPVSATEEHTRELWSLVHSHSRLQQAGYVLWTLSQADLDKKKRCGRCSKVIRRGHEKQQSRTQSVKLAPTMAQRIAADYVQTNRGEGQASMPAHARSVSLQETGADLSDVMRDREMKNYGDAQGRDRGPPMNCRYHPGRAHHGRWTCCGGNSIYGAPCMAEQFHQTRVYRHGELERNWQYFATPHPAAAQMARVAVVIDCEMGTAESGESELIRVSAVDFFTRRVLVDNLVWPDVRMAHFNTRYSGVSRPSMEAAHRARRTLAGRAGAREALWRFVGPETILVGHSANSDLNALRWIHPIVIDTLLLEMRIQPRPPEERRPEQQQSRATAGDGDDDQDRQPPVAVAEVPKKERPKYPGLSLKALAAERLQRQIQSKNQGHDSLQDALATRDLLLWHLINKPEPPVFD